VFDERNERVRGGSMKQRLPMLMLVTFLVLTSFGAEAQVSTPADLEMPQSHDPLSPYTPDRVPEPALTNSARLDTLIRDGKLYLSLKDAIDLALENNLDLAIARYNLPIADTDVLRTKAGGSFRGVNTGVVQTTPGGGVGGYGAGAPGVGAGGTTVGAGGAGAGNAGLVQSTLGAGTPIAHYDPQLTVTAGIEHLTSPLSSTQVYGIPSLQLNTGQVDVIYSQAFATGGSISVEFNNSRQTTNSPFIFLSPALNSYFRVTLQQPILAGFGFGPNLRYLRIAKNNKKISDIAFRDQVIATITQIEDIYWDLVSAYEEARVNEESLAFANQSLENAKKQLQLESIPAMDVMKAEAEVSKRDQDLTVARTTLELQQSLMKNALTKSLDDPALEEIPVVPSDRVEDGSTGDDASEPIADLIAEGLRSRPELLETDVDLDNRQISRQAARNALLPSLSLVGYYGGSGLGGLVPAGIATPSSAPTDLTGTWENTFNNSSPDYFVGFNLSIPFRNRIAKADQYRSELEYRQASLRREQLKKQIRIDIRNAQYALEQSRARVDSARKARDLAERTFEITRKEQELGAGSSFQTMTAQRDLSLAQLDLVTAKTTYEKARVELDRATGTTLEHNGVLIQEAVTGTVAGSSP
jgi:outer membrane protein TolC